MRTPTCTCGTCPKCQRRAYHQQWKAANPDYMPTYYDTRDPARIERRTARNWTAEQDEYLGLDTDAEVARCLGKTLKAVEHRRRRLGIKAYVKRGPRKATEGGYVQVVLEPDDPLIEMTRTDRSVLEHRLAMARRLGRPLTRDEFVHHRNGIRTDNRIANLELWTRSHPDGQRVEDVLEWARDFIERYESETATVRR